MCGADNPQKHHIDYNHPLHIVWLCKKHHYDIHSKLRIDIQYRYWKRRNRKIFVKTYLYSLENIINI